MFKIGIGPILLGFDLILVYNIESVLGFPNTVLAILDQILALEFD